MANCPNWNSKEVVDKMNEFMAQRGQEPFSADEIKLLKFNKNKFKESVSEERLKATYFAYNSYNRINEVVPKESELKKAFGIYKNYDLSESQSINIKKNVDLYNRKHGGTSWFVEFDKITYGDGRFVYSYKDIIDKKTNRSIGQIHKERILSGTQTSLFQEGSVARTTANKDLNKRLISLLSNLVPGLKVEYHDSLIDRLGIDAVGVADLYNRMILVSKNKEDESTLPEEVGHFIYELLQDTDIGKRMYELITRTDTYKEVSSSEEYQKRYKNNESLIRKEAIGKLIGEVLIKKSKDESTVESGILATLKRLWERFKQIFRKIDENKILNEVESVFGEVADRFMSETLDNINLSNLDNIDKKELFQIEKEETNKLKQSLLDSLAVLDSMIKYQTEKGGKESAAKNIHLLEQLKMKFNNKKYLVGITTLIENLNTQLGDIEKDIVYVRSILNNPENKIDFSDIGKRVREMSIFTEAFSPIIDELSNDLYVHKLETKEFSAELDGLLSTMRNNLGNISIEIKNISKKASIMWQSSFGPSEVTFTMGPKKGEKVSIEKSMDVLEKDVTMMGRLFNSASRTKDFILTRLDKIVKVYKYKAIDYTRNLIKDLITLKMNLEKSGIKDTSWMAERDSEGNVTGNFVTEFNQGEYERQKQIHLEKLINVTFKKEKLPIDYREREEIFNQNAQLEALWNKEWGRWYKDNRQNNPKAKQIIADKKSRLTKLAFAQWYRDNTSEDSYGNIRYRGELTIPAEKYRNKKYSEIMNNSLKREFYEKWLSVKKDSESNLPEKVRKNMEYKMPQTRKDMIERLSSGGVNSILDKAKTGFSELFTTTEDEIERGNRKDRKKTYPSGKLLKSLPIYFTNDIKNKNDLSLDFVSSLAAYAYMANDYGSMSKIIDIAEITKDALSLRKVAEQDYEGQPIKKTFKFLREEVIGIVPKSGASNAYARIVDFFNANIYGEFKKEEGSVNIFGKKLDFAKTIDTLTTHTAIMQFALNLYAGINNALNAEVQMAIEALSGQYLKPGSMKNGTLKYWANIPSTLSQVGSRNNTDKLTLWGEYMDVVQSLGVPQMNIEQKNLFQKMFRRSNLFFLNHMGEHEIQFRLSLALANEFKVKLKDGTIVDYFDAHEVVGNKLMLKDGATKVDGSAITEDDRYNFMFKQREINQLLNGAYTNMDAAAIQQWSLGRAAMMFRKFIPPGIDRRFSNVYYNEMLGEEHAGYYRTTAWFINGLRKDLMRGQLAIMKNWNELTDTEKANFHRTMSEVGIFIGLVVLSNILTSLSGNDDDDWALNMSAYQARRLITEMSFYVNPNETFRILKSPAASVTVVQNMIDFLDFTDWTTEIKSGKYKGHTWFYKRGVQSIPGFATYDKLMTPEEQLKFFK